MIWPLILAAVVGFFLLGLIGQWQENWDLNHRNDNTPGIIAFVVVLIIGLIVG